MNIRTRLKISNLLMILVPVAIAIVAGALAVLVAWQVLARGSGIGVDDSEDFHRASGVVAATAAHVLEEGSLDGLATADSVLQMLDASAMSLVVLAADGTSAYSYGHPEARDEALLAAGSALGGSTQISSEGRCLSAWDVEADGTTYRLCILGNAQAGSELLTKAVLVGAAAVLVLVLVATVVLTNRFLTLFVLRHITDPLDLLAQGARQIHDGNLSFRLPADREDEFAPVFSDFNDMAARLATSVERDRRAAERRSTLLVGLSHDLRSPLTSIQAYAEGLLDGVARTPEATDRYLRMIKRKAEEMGRLLRRLSAVARMERQADEASLAPVALDETVSEWLDENGDAYALLGVHIESQLGRAVVLADRELVGRVLSNLLDNCARYARGMGGSCLVRLSCAFDPQAGGAVLAVDDDGPGVSEASCARLFDLFYRGDAARSDVEEGNGIGLCVVALAMGRMGGSAVAGRSELGGLRVELRFPPRAAGTGGSAGEDAGADGEGEGERRGADTHR